MKKIPTMMRRDPENLQCVLAEVTPGCEWVLAGEGRALRKYDGLCVLIRRDGMAVKTFTRRLVKPHQKTPDNFTEIEHDPNTGNRFGWIPSAQSGYQKFIDEALGNGDVTWTPGTYELCGPKIDHNREGCEGHQLLKHETAPAYEPLSFTKLEFADIISYMVGLGTAGWEGIVWHHPDGRMAKIKARDFGIKRG